MEKLIVFILLVIGKKPTFSTGICGRLTCGYGELDHNGYWQYQLNNKQIDKYREKRGLI